MEQPTPHFFSDSACYPSSPSPPQILPSEEEPASADVVPLRRLSEYLLYLLLSPPEIAFCYDARIVVGTGESEREVDVLRCILSTRSHFFRERFTSSESGIKLELKDLLPRFRVEYEALAAVLEYIYGGRVQELPRGIAECADEECVRHEACWPAVHFMIQVLYAAATFEIQELASLFQILCTGNRSERSDFYSIWGKFRWVSAMGPHKDGVFIEALCLILCSNWKF